jgi:hypothetical protein
MRELPQTTFQSWVPDGRSVFSADSFIAGLSVCVFMSFDSWSLIGFQSPPISEARVSVSAVCRVATLTVSHRHLE